MKIFEEKAKVEVEHGLLTSKAWWQHSGRMPVAREKMDKIMKRLDLCV